MARSKIVPHPNSKSKTKKQPAVPLYIRTTKHEKVERNLIKQEHQKNQCRNFTKIDLGKVWDIRKETIPENIKNLIHFLGNKRTCEILENEVKYILATENRININEQKYQT